MASRLRPQLLHEEPRGGEREWLVSFWGTHRRTVCEWYDFYPTPAATIIQRPILLGRHDTHRLSSSGGPLRAGSRYGRSARWYSDDWANWWGGGKVHFLITMSIMGGATFAVGLLPTYGRPRRSPHDHVVVLRLPARMALGGEYGGGRDHIAEHAPHGQARLFTSWIQNTATLGLFAALLVVIGTRTLVGEELQSVGLAHTLSGIRLAARHFAVDSQEMAESLFLKMKAPAALRRRR